MTTDILSIAGQIAGIGGLALGIFLILFKDFLKKNVFSSLSQSQSYKIFKLFLILVFSISVLGLVAWIASQWMGSKTEELKIVQLKKELSDEKIKLRLSARTLEGYQLINAQQGNISPFVNGFKFKLTVQNIGKNNIIESIYMILVKYYKPANSIITKPRLDSMKFGDIRLPHQLHVVLSSEKINGYWLLSGESKVREIKPSSNGAINLLITKDDSDLDFTSNQTGNEVISGTVTAIDPGVYDVFFQVNYYNKNSENITQIKTEEIEIYSQTSKKNPEEDGQKIFSSENSYKPEIVKIAQQEAEDGASESSIGPANLLDAFMPLYAITGKQVTVLTSNKYDLGDLSGSPISSVDPLMILLILQKTTQPKSNIASTIMVSDGNINHALSPQKVTEEGSYRLYYYDPWYDHSFLEKGSNIINADARREGNGVFSIDYKDFEKSIVAIGFVDLNKEKTANNKQRGNAQ